MYVRRNCTCLYNCEILFKVKERNSTIRYEIYYGLIHFISCLYILAVIPQQLSKAGYNVDYTVVAVGACCGVGSIVGGLFTNLPFVIAPTSVVSIFLSVIRYLQSGNLGPDVGSAAVVLSGLVLMLLFGNLWSYFHREVNSITNSSRDNIGCRIVDRVGWSS